MFRGIYRALSLAQAKSAANRLLNAVSNHQLESIGISRETFVSEVIVNFEKSFELQDVEEMNKSKRNAVSNTSISVT
jgi:uncharacterized protein YjiS (DUF1127 family)